jgi:hemerythrin-like domain-containing protein
MFTFNSIQTINQPHIPDFTDPVGLLARCHEKIAGQMGTLEQAAEFLREGDSQLISVAFAAIDSSCSHFATAGVKHTQDEELSLFPRLRECGAAAGQEALAALAELESQHRTAEAFHGELEQLVARLPRDGSANPADLDLLSELSAQLSGLYRPHIMLENEFVFPIAARVLHANELQLLGREMRARRGLVP